MTKATSAAIPLNEEELASIIKMPLKEARVHLASLSPQERLIWAYQNFGLGFALTTSFGIQSSVLLHMIKCLDAGSEIPVIWVDTGYLPKETYLYANQLSEELSLNVKVFQSPISPARMEALHGRLWETDSVKDLEKYHLIRKVQPLEEGLEDLNVICWASGVRGGQTDARNSMSLIDPIRGRFSVRPLLDWTPKDVFYYMEKHRLPQHPLFEKGYSTVGDWHSSGPDSNQTQGRNTRFRGLKQECGIHLPGMMGDGI